MAKKSAIEKNHYRERLVKKNASRRKRLKALAADKNVTLQERFQASLKLAQMPRNGSPVRVRRRCFLTGRPRGVYREYGISRIAIRELALSGQLPGVIKASW
ncbi:30S ribosomal protein S14 [Candidatus Hepatobacter penaei]|uniref:30S ribosomal protein S14 n=1 Tax=Candidatus Hepatobacter penaei TaxID=1274402 RepID=UPI0004F398DF|nr:30S ribosomal protein S14 [Candidatus Hepatobacter penaei]TGW15901.1 30S ribosomal protein S14 [bacterium NHP-B]